MRMHGGWSFSGAVALTLAGSLVLSGCFVNGGEDAQGDEARIIGGTITEDTVLTNIFDDPGKPDYIVDRSLLVRAKLTVEPGVVIAFSRETRVEVDGRGGGILWAEGTEQDPVVFTGATPTPGFWQGIYFDNVVAQSNGLEWTIVEYGGGRSFGHGLEASNLGAGGFVGETEIAITNSTFRHSAGFGIELESGSKFRSFERNHFENNAKAALRIGVDQRAKIDAETTGLQGGVELIGTVLATQATWGPLDGGAPTRILKDFFVKAPLVIEPGTELQFGDGVGMTIEGAGGTLSARGTADAPIIMEPAGDYYWKGVYYENSASSTNRLEHVTIDRAGFGAFLHRGGHQAALVIGAFVGSSTVTVTDSTISDSYSDGLVVDRGSTVNEDIEEVNSFINNAGEDVTFR